MNESVYISLRGSGKRRKKYRFQHRSTGETHRWSRLL